MEYRLYYNYQRANGLPRQTDFIYETNYQAHVLDTIANVYKPDDILIICDTSTNTCYTPSTWILEHFSE
jgi:hypothetical protein